MAFKERLDVDSDRNFLNELNTMFGQNLNSGHSASGPSIDVLGATRMFAEAQSTIDSLSNEMGRKEEKIEKMGKKLEKRNAKIDQLTKSFEELTAKVTELTTSVTSITADLETQKTESAGKDTKITELEQKVTELTSQIEAKDVELAKKSKKDDDPDKEPDDDPDDKKKKEKMAAGAEKLQVEKGSKESEEADKTFEAAKAGSSKQAAKEDLTFKEAEKKIENAGNDENSNILRRHDELLVAVNTGKGKPAGAKALREYTKFCDDPKNLAVLSNSYLPVTFSQ